MGNGRSGDERHGEDTYVFPRHPSEIDRLDIQHYALREALAANFLAPVQRPEYVLDVGTGSGQWAFDLCDQFPAAVVVGLDLVPGKPDWPDNYGFIKGNLLHGLPFRNDQFDFVHQRLLQSGVALRWWFAGIEELVRVTRPGGWVELVEVKHSIEPSGPATRRLLSLLSQVAGSMGLDRTGVIFERLDEYLRRAGLVDVTRRDVDLPTGEWGGRVGSLLASDLRALFARLVPAFEARLDVPAEESGVLMTRMTQEWEEQHSISTFGFAFGRKA